MTLELNREYPELDDPKIFEHMVNLTLGQMKPILGHLRRAQHAKTTGCVAAEFRIADDVPSDLRYGVLSQPGRTFRAMVPSACRNPDYAVFATLAAIGARVMCERLSLTSNTFARTSVIPFE